MTEPSGGATGEGGDGGGGGQNMFQDIFGSDLEDSDKEGEATSPAPEGSEAPVGSEGGGVGGGDEEDADEEDDELKILRRKRQQLVKRGRGEEEERALRKKKKRKRKERESMSSGKKLRMKAEGVGPGGVGGFGGEDGVTGVDFGKDTDVYDDDDGFIDDTGAEKVQEDPDDVIRTEGGFDVGSDIEAGSGREEEAQPSTYFEQQMDELRKVKGRRKQDMDTGRIEEECMAFISRMMQARDLDITAYRNEKPALNKLKMLPEVEDMLAKVDFRDILLENLLLPVIKSWLDPMPDGALPNINIRKRLLELLDSFHVDQDWVQHLRKSQGLGKVVNYLSIRDDYEPNKRLAKKLIGKWSRPIYQSGSHSRKEEYARQREARAVARSGTTVAHLNERKRQRIGVATYMAQKPARVEFNFRKEPESRVTAADRRPEKKESRRSKKWERAARGIRMSQKRSSHAVRVSVEGRDATL